MTTLVVERALHQLVGELPDLRRAAGGGASLEVALGRVERPEMAAARWLEEGGAVARAVPVTGEPTCGAFLDGVQESREVAWVGTLPLVFGRVAAVVRERVEGRLTTWGDGATRSEAIYAVWDHLPRRTRALFQEFGLEVRDVAADAPLDDVHPMRLMQDATNAVKQDREALERDLAATFCARDPRALYIDGPLPSDPVVFESAAVVGVIKSHQTLYVAGADLATVLGLAAAERSSVFAIEGRHRPPVASWYLRVRNPEGRGPFWGLVRVEIPLALYHRLGPVAADERSGWVLAERAPLALPDGRWDTMAYGIRNCEEYLRSVLA